MERRLNLVRQRAIGTAVDVDFRAEDREACPLTRPVDPGFDVMTLHSLLLHRSYHELSHRIRIATGTNMRSSTDHRSEEHTSELQSLKRISYAVFCLKKTKTITEQTYKRPST